MVAVPSPQAIADVPTRDRAANERLRAIILEHYDFVWRSVRRLGVPPPETDDATQQTFIVLSRKLDRVEAGKERQFLFGIAMRVASSARRARAKLREVSEVPGEDDPRVPFVLPTVEARLDRAVARQALDEILAGMSDERRAVFVLAVFEEHSLADIATTLQIPITTVASRLKAAREALESGIARIRARRQGV
ncbi:RNA polymerase sigma factor RpoE [Labilithrix luteola]|uniref:RNA polymerase sigma factor RpoE n=1 Tax=Labilithrix luteola TaxID=1391654 RepID=A0A0K1QC29_9BACT|nr:sigma-70 family RNA polymerase sigma factor [Labilithrix luteola]AKV03304.1 RNA polymerase sigma factor RpoE [Labilithrix luteola]